MSIPDFFAGQTVLLTGGTGFLGKVFVEKLLRSCPGISRMYLLVRSKKGVHAQDRWKQITNAALFDRLKRENPEALGKVITIDCNMKDKGLGLSKEDEQELIENVTLVYHAAATVQFNNNIIDSLKENTRATYFILELAKSMKNLKVFCYVSTTYCNYNRPEEEWQEQVYPAPISWRLILKLLDFEEVPLSIIKDKILFGHPNPYTLSKNLAEQIVQDYCHLFPCLIVRPSIISCTLEEPFPGWQDVINGVASLCTGAALGILRVFRVNSTDYHAYIPVDKAANTMAVATKKIYTEKKTSGLEVYNCTITKGENIVNIDNYTKCLEFGTLVPSKHVIWSPHFYPTENYLVFYVLFLLQMVLPFSLVDLHLRISGKKPRLVNIAIKLMACLKLFEPFLYRQIGFPNEKYLQLEHTLQGKDKKDFSIKVGKLDVVAEIAKAYEGILKYYLKEEINEKTIKVNGERLKRLIMLDRIIKIISCSALLWLAVKWIMQSSILESFRQLINEISF